MKKRSLARSAKLCLVILLSMFSVFAFSGRSWSTEPLWRVFEQTGTFPQLSFSADGSRLLSTTQFQAVVFDTASGKKVATIGSGSFERTFASGSLSQDGRQVTIVVKESGGSWQLEVIEPLASSSTTKTLSLLVGDSVETHQVSANRRFHLLANYGEGPWLVDGNLGQQTRIPTDRSGAVGAVAVDGKTYVTNRSGLAAFDPDGSKSWSLEDEAIYFAGGMALSSDESALAAYEILGDDGQNFVRIYDLKERNFRQDVVLPSVGRSYIDAIQFDGDALIVSQVSYDDKDARLFFVHRLSMEGEVRKLVDLELGSDNARSAITPDGKTIAVVDTGGQLALYPLGDDMRPTASAEPPRPRLVAGNGHQAALSAAAFSPDGRLFGTADADGQVWVWEKSTGRAIRSVKLEGTTVIRFSDDSRSILAVDRQNFVEIDIATGETVFRRSSLGDRPFLLQKDPNADGFVTCVMRGCGFITRHARHPKRVDLPASNYAAGLYCGEQFALLERGDDSRVLVTIGADSEIVPVRIALDSATESVACAEGGGFFVGTSTGQVQRVAADGTILAFSQSGTRAISHIAQLADGSLLVVEKGIGYVGRYDLPAKLIHLDQTDLAVLDEASFPNGEDGTAAYAVHLAVADDGRNAITATATGLAQAGKIAIWDTANLARRGEPQADALLARKVQFVPDGSGLAVTLRDSSVVWSFADGKPKLTLPHELFGNLSMRGDAIFYIGDRAKHLINRRLPSAGVESLVVPDELSEFELLDTEAVMTGNTLAIGYSDGVVIWPSATETKPDPVVVETLGAGSDAPRTFNPIGNLLLTQSWKEVIVHDLSFLERGGVVNELWRRELDGTPNTRQGQDAGFAVDGKSLLIAASPFEDRKVQVLDARSGRLEQVFEESLLVHIPASDGMPAAKIIMRINEDDTALLLKSAEDPNPAHVRLEGILPQFAIADRDAETLIISGLQGETLLWRADMGQTVRLDTQIVDVDGVSFSPDGEMVAIVGADGLVRLWSTGAGAEIAVLIAQTDSNWAVVDSSGRYDARDPGYVPGLNWVIQDEPFRPEPVEIYFLDYFEPRLLARHMAGEKFPQTVSPAARNRVTPEIRFDSVEQIPGSAGELPRATVTLNLRPRARADRSSGSGLVKLFRDGQLIATRLPESRDSQEWVSIAFDNVGLPPDRSEVVFTAFAFNDDGIKSETVSKTVEVRRGDASTGRRAYVVAIGVNVYDNSSWNLRYAAADAEAHVELVASGLRVAGRYDEVIELPLISRGARDAELGPPPRLADRNTVISVLKRLAGDPISEPLPDAAEQLLARIKPIRPQDFLYIAFAGHGLATPNGMFHLFTQEFGQNTIGRSIDDLSASLNSELLASLLSRIDARDMLLVIDACNSAASIEGGDFRPGPMNSRGLGQLAYDKSIRVLAASQAEAVALESEKLLHGALTYALVREGLEGGLADRFPRDGNASFDELILFAEQRVPDLYLELLDGSFTPLDRGATALWKDGSGPGDIDVQRPAVFDFRPANAEPIFLHIATR